VNKDETKEAVIAEYQRIRKQLEETEADTSKFPELKLMELVARVNPATVITSTAGRLMALEAEALLMIAQLNVALDLAAVVLAQQDARITALEKTLNAYASESEISLLLPPAKKDLPS
jgi:hypothetical protein